MKTYSEFHDGFFEGIRSDKDMKVVHVYLSTDRKVRTTAVLNGVLKLKAEGLRRQHYFRCVDATVWRNNVSGYC